jgi:Calcineurin-like phosphoesterase
MRSRATDSHARVGIALAVVAGLVALAGAGCSPLGAYRGVTPASGSIPAFAGRAAVQRAVEKTRDVPWIESGTTNLAAHHLGTLALPGNGDSVIAFVYGDNRAGMRMQDRIREYDAVKELSTRHVQKWPAGLAWLPIFLVESFVPTLDGPRDLVSAWVTRTPTGGHEKRVLGAMMDMLPVDFTINTGDLVNDGRRGALWERWSARHDSLRHAAPFLGVPGNHERMSFPTSRTNWDAAMGPPAEPERYWFSVDLPGRLARFVFLDAEVMTDPRGNFKDPAKALLAREQLGWADTALAFPARYKFIVLHHPILSAGHHLNDWGTEPQVDLSATRRARLLDIVHRRKVLAVFAGHEHLYQRAWVGFADGSGFWHVTAGGGGAPLYWISPRERRMAMAHELPLGAVADSASAFGKSVNNFCRMVIPRHPQAGRDSVTLTAYHVWSNGKTDRMDQFTLTHAPPGAGVPRPAGQGHVEHDPGHP